MEVDHRKLNPNAAQLARFITDPEVRLIIMYGGSSSGKSYSAAQIILLQTLCDGENTLVLRKVAASVEKSIYEDFKVAASQLGIGKWFLFRDGLRKIKCVLNGAKIDFGGLDNPEKIKGISNYMRLLLEELSEFELVDFKQLRKRLRGKRGQKIIADFNPISESHWIKTQIFDTEKWHSVTCRIEGYPMSLTRVKRIRMNSPKPMLNPVTREIETHAPDTVLIQSTYLNNFWVIGSPDGKYGYYDEQCVADFEKDRVSDPDYYNIYALGEWGVVRTGAEFFNSFSRGVHVMPIAYDPSLPIHLSVDNNRLPYISYSFWQADLTEGVRLRQIHEICAKSPHNSAYRSAKLVAEYLRSIGYREPLFLHGDASTRSGSTTDDDGRSFLDKVISSLQEEGIEVIDKVCTSNPSVSMTGEFINAIWDGSLEGLAIDIGDTCRVSIDDYMCVQKDANGKIAKTKIKDKVTMQTYEPYGHLSDTLRYVAHDIMREQYLAFANKRKYNLYAKDGAIRFFNPDTEYGYDGGLAYCMPNVGGRMVMVYGRRCGEVWHITHVSYLDTSSTDEISRRIAHVGCSPTYVETAKSYYPLVREIRRQTGLVVKVLPEEPDMDRRIAATSDFVRTSVLFSESQMSASEEYSEFVSALLDYNAESRQKQASAALSGFVKVAIKLP